MHISHSFPASALLLSFSTLTEAWSWQHGPIQNAPKQARKPSEYRPRGASPDGIFGKRQATLVCPNDRFEQFLDNRPPQQVATFCNDWLGIPPATTTVETTPTITVTTSAASTTSTTVTTRLITTLTVTQTATTTVPAFLARAVNVAAVAEASVLFQSVVASGIDAQTTSASSVSPQRLEAESGLDHACSCALVNPTATVTATFTVPAVYTTVGFRVVNIRSVTDTRVLTAYTTVTETLPTGSGNASDEPPVGTSAPTDGGSGTNDGESSVPQTTEPVPTAPITTTDIPAVSSTIPADGIVTALPFSCPEDDGNRITQVVGESRFDYLVRCDTELQTEDRVASPVLTESNNACAARCSLMNSQSNQDTCKAASFAPYTDGRAGGLCTISLSDPLYVDRPGSTAIVHTGTLSSGDECNFINGTNTSIDADALIASITAAGISISTPGLQTQSVAGGVSQTYVSANSTDASGFVHWSWYAISASSSFWWAAYSTSWECTATLTRVIVQEPVTPVASEDIITTIIRGSTTTIISGGSTQVITVGGGGSGGSGVSPPTMVSASTTISDGEITTFFSSATPTATGSDGIISATDVAEVTVSDSTFAVVSSASDGVIPPSAAPTDEVVTVVSSGGTLITISGSTSTITEDGGAGVIPPESSEPTEVVTVSEGTLVVTISGSTSTITEDGGAGVIPPESSEPTEVVTVSEGTLVVTISGSTATLVSTDDSGVIPPASSPEPSTETIVIVSSGDASSATSSSTLTAEESDGSGIIPPVSTGIIVIPVETETLFIVSSTGGSDELTISGSAATASSTDDSGVIPPPATDASSSVPVTSTPDDGPEDPTSTPDADIEVSTTTLTAVISTSSGTLVIVSTDDSGIIPPSSADITSGAPAISEPTPDISITVTGGSDEFTEEVITATTVTTGDDGIVTPITETLTVSIPPISSDVNITVTIPSSTGPDGTISDFPRTGGFSTSTLTSTGSNGSITPPEPTGETSEPATSDVPVASEPATSDVPAASEPATSDVPAASEPATSDLPGASEPATSDVPATSAIDESSSIPATETPASSLDTSSMVTESVDTTTGDRTGSFSTTEFPESSIPTSEPEPSPTGPSSSLPDPSEGTETPIITLSADTTITPPLATNNSTVPVPTTSGFDNSTTSDICPTAPVTVTVVEAGSVQIQTTTVVETITATLAPLSVISTADEPVLPTVVPEPLDLQTEARLPGILATPNQVNSACNSSINVVQNPNFLVESDGSVPRWSVDNHDSAVLVGTEASPDGNGTIAQFKSQVVGRTLTITQPLTVCPGQQYLLSSMNRQGNLLAGCTAEYTVGDERVFLVTPEEDWLVTRGFFTAGVGVEGASVDLRITASCRGYAGVPVTDQEGWMRVEVSGVAVTLDEGTTRRRRRAVQVQAVTQDVEEFAALLLEAET